MNERKAKYPIHPLILNRWSPRALSGKELSEEELMSLFEAARWAPSSYNNQPWFFLYARKNSKYWKTFFDLLVDFNKSWVKNASVLILILSNKLFSYNHKPSRTHRFDTGAAWENMALQGSSIGLVVHGMEGFDYDRARKELNIPEEYDIEAMIAVGKKGKTEDLPKDLQKEESPSIRKNLNEIAKEGKF